MYTSLLWGCRRGIELSVWESHSSHVVCVLKLTCLHSFCKHVRSFVQNDDVSKDYLKGGNADIGGSMFLN